MGLHLIKLFYTYVYKVPIHLIIIVILHACSACVRQMQ